MLKVGVLGAGHLGKIHLRLLQQSEKYELVGFYDPNLENAEKINKEFGYKNFKKTYVWLSYSIFKKKLRSK